MRPVFCTLALTLAVSLPAAADIHNGSTGALGALNVTTSQTLALPADGVLNYSTVFIAAGVTLSFQRNALNTPVFLLATGDVVINGNIDVSASDKNGGPGGFDGGSRGFGTIPPGPGHGPGGGGAGDQGGGGTSRGAGGYGTRPDLLTAQAGQAYGSPLLVPLVGGSGGGGAAGNPGRAGAGGGGAILIASAAQIVINGSGAVFADGSIDGDGARACYGEGSGGAIRLVAPRIAGSGRVFVLAGGYCSTAGDGRVRVDTIDRSAMAFDFEPGTRVVSQGTFLVAFPDAIPRLDVTQVAGQSIAGGAVATVTLPFGTDPHQNVLVRAQDFSSGLARAFLRLEPSSGAATVLGPFNIANNTTATIAVTFDINNPTRVLVWGTP